ncbi:DUF4954 family protein [Brachyspira hyodysenteriae]|nr:DUF4954 family protein [Brachyspira hyodysenteriae]MCZ9938510.1 DUF4954 family protein [Brachyspira hyodysenteriae]MCZ9961044.1 DUF4954 family protein [Brachyspira hyodysenteriae]MDA0054127.1 DUF4954 family protein [Brachyspira hyodysenteriae]
MKEITIMEIFLTYKNMIIKISSLDKYSKRYSIAIDLYLHNKILSYIENSKNIDEIIKNLNYDENSIFEKWVDIGGLICAKQRIDNIIKDLENDKISDVKSLTERFEDIYNLYLEDEKSWVMNTIKSRYNIKDIDKETIKKLLINHISLLEEAYNIFYKDVEKEYDASKMVSSGIDDKSVMEKDFDAVRGTVNDNTFVIKYKKDMENKIESINNIINIL